MLVVHALADELATAIFLVPRTVGRSTVAIDNIADDVPSLTDRIELTEIRALDRKKRLSLRLARRPHHPSLADGKCRCYELPA